MLGSSYCIFQSNQSVTFNVKVLMSQNYEMQGKMNSWLKENNMLFQDEYSFNVTLSDLKIKSVTQLTDQEHSNLQAMANQRQQMLQMKLQAMQTAMLSQDQAHQDSAEKMNLGLTFVIMFLALVELSFIIYEHSNDDERKDQYYTKKSIEKYRDVV